jgi:integrase/recombinase XerC
VTRLTAIRGGGRRRPPPAPGGVCGVPHREECRLLGRHLEWLRLRGRAERTIRERRYNILRLGRWLAPVPVVDATAADLAAWRASLRVSPSAAASYIVHAKMFYAWCADEDIIGSSPAARLPSPRTRPGLPRPIPAARLAAALASAPERVRPWLLLGAFAGLRAAEIASLTADCLLLDRDPPLIVVAGKGGRERAVPVSAYLAGELAALSLPRSGWIFPRLDGQGGPNAAWLVSHKANEHLRSLGFPDTFHSLRHYAATAAYQGTRDLLAVSHFLGHANVATTAVYARFSDPAVIAAVEAIPAPPRLHVVRESGEGNA